MKYWLLLEKSDETRISKGIDGYRDLTGELYQYDSLVPNYKQVSTGDVVVLRKESDIIGIGMVGEISAHPDSKTHRRCPTCNSTDIRERRHKTPCWKCGQCRLEFTTPVTTNERVLSFVATIRSFTRLSAPPSVKAVKNCALSENGLASQLSMIQLDPTKIQTLLEGLDPMPSSRSVLIDPSPHGVGFSRLERQAVERRAIEVTHELYERAGWRVIDQSLSHPFELLATRDATERFIKVRGSTGAGQAVSLTQGDVAYVRGHPESSALVVVSGIVLKRADETWTGYGGVITTHRDPWVLIDTSLQATGYRYSV
jgi:ribosomal protein L37AE/L43A